MVTLDENLLWQVRTFVYQHFAATTFPPTVDETAARFHIESHQAATLFEELNQRHAFFLEPGTHRIRIANPFSAVPTLFRVRAQGKSYWANCAWDALGIPAALHCDAVIDASYAEDNLPLVLTVSNAQVISPNVIVHFLVPFHRWYEDMTVT